MAEQLYQNATVLTMNPRQPLAEAVVVEGGRITFVGGNAEAREYARAGTRGIDLAGQTLIPGFNEAHNHMITFGLALAQIEAGYPAVRSIAAIMTAFATRARETAPGA